MSLEITHSSVEVSPPAISVRQNRWSALGMKIVVFLYRGLTVRNLTIFCVVSAFAALLLLFAGYFAHLVFTKTKQVEAGSLAHTYFISKFVRKMPAFKPLENSQTYYFNLISNASIPAYIMRYESVAPPEEIISYYRLYFEILNYAYMRHSFDSEALAMFRNTREGFTVFVSVGENVNTVFIENFKYD